MNRNEPSSVLRKGQPTPIYDGNGSLLASQLFKTSTGEMAISLDGATIIAAANDGVEIGAGFYYYPFSQAETNRDVFALALFRQKARLNLATKTTNCTTKIRAKAPGDGGNVFTITWVQSGVVSPTTGTLTLSGTDYTFTFKDGTTTVANFEALITSSTNLEIDVAGATATLHTVDAFAATNLAGGLRDQGCTQIIDQADSTAAIAAAVGSGLLVGSYTRDQIARLVMAIEAGSVTDFTTNTLVFVCPVTGKTRLTIPLMATGRGTPTIGDLT